MSPPATSSSGHSSSVTSRSSAECEKRCGSNNNLNASFADKTNDDRKDHTTQADRNSKDASLNLIEFSSLSSEANSAINNPSITNGNQMMEIEEKSVTLISCDKYESVRLAYFDTPFNFYLQIDSDRLDF